MTVRVSKPAFNIREALNSLRRKIGIKGGELMSAETAADAYAVLNPVMYRNRIINGDMRIDQRNAGASVTITSTTRFAVDRFTIDPSADSKLTAQQSANAVTPPPGCGKYLGITSTSSYAIGASDYFLLNQRIEGQNIVDLAWGTPNASPVTLSFWVRSSIAGVFGGALRNGASNMSYPYNYTVNAANTWELKTVTIPGATSGTWASDNSIAMFVYWSLGAGASYTGPAGAWAATNYVNANGSTSLVGTNGATFYITGIQLEKGSVATPFEFRPYGTELALCQRYYTKSFPVEVAPTQNSGVATVVGNCLGGGFGTQVTVRFGVSMRAAPTITGYNPNAANDRVRNNSNSTDIQYVGISSQYTNGFIFYPYGANHDSFQNYQWCWNWTASAEL